jgi:hypothetical protein
MTSGGPLRGSALLYSVREFDIGEGSNAYRSAPGLESCTLSGSGVRCCEAGQIGESERLLNGIDLVNRIFEAIMAELFALDIFEAFAYFIVVVLRKGGECQTGKTTVSSGAVHQDK